MLWPLLLPTLPSYPRLGQRMQIENLTQLLLAQSRHLPRHFADGLAFLVGFLGNLGGFVVADDGRERSAHGEALLDQRFTAFAVGFDAFDAGIGEVARRGGE